MASIASVQGPQDCQAPGPHPLCLLGSHEAHPPSHLDPQLPAVPSAPCCTLSSLLYPLDVDRVSHLPLCSYTQAPRASGKASHPAHLVSLPGAPSSLLANGTAHSLQAPAPHSPWRNQRNPGGHRLPQPRPPTRLCRSLPQPQEEGPVPTSPLRTRVRSCLASSPCFGPHALREPAAHLREGCPQAPDEVGAFCLHSQPPPFPPPPYNCHFTTLSGFFADFLPPKPQNPPGKDLFFTSF